ncbi:ABC transporter substrate-binding protein [Mesorhizobium sp. BAC0120]|uniref:ABC transporter substrate-binding protein n=1 Tax=Mesorhizobium sp. BAC0120 TaxID=3090670 RepID=UPI00298D0F8D|nr:ABC transporter substrate-binding protein [Mesorhizobium sp. BAC0120]MDW6023220.1 ABC transporter substrate-binding protein [Mesorhizobium sp. BAC0120]
MKELLKSLLAGTALVAGLSLASAETIRLEWVMQGQFAGPILALEKGYYKEAGVDIQLLPAGPDIKPSVTVATGADTFGIGHPNQVISARANGAPLVMVSQHGQRSATTYIARKDSGISSVKDMPGHSVGLWFGGDEQEFLAMLNQAGIDQSSVNIVSQGYDIIGWLNKDYEVMQVAIYNELQQVYRQGYKKEDLVFLDPTDDASIISGGLFTTEKTIQENPKAVQAAVDATLRGWKEAIADPKAAAEIVVKYNSELKLEEQIEQIKAMGELFCAGPTLHGEFGKSELKNYQVAQNILLGAKLIDQPIELEKAFTNEFWEKAPADYKTINCGS